MESALDKLSQQEQNLCEHICSLPETIDDRELLLAHDGTFEKYREIHRDYFDLFHLTKNSEVKLETLKRMIFLNWYSMVEPSFFSGLENLDNLILVESYTTLNECLKAPIVDQELKWMISYYSMFEWVILEFCERGLDTLTNFVKSVDPSKNHLPNYQIIIETMQNRGQMGMYFLGISERH